MFRCLFTRWASGKKLKEASHCLSHLKAADRQELGLQLAGATDMRHKLYGLWSWDLLQPRDLVERDAAAAFKVVRLIQEQQRRGNLVEAASLMIWAHTLRASPVEATSDLKLTVRAIWEQLHLGDLYVEHAANDAMLLFKRPLDIDGYEETPDGFASDRHPRTVA